MSKEIRDYFVFALLRYVVGLENSRHFLNQSAAKLQPITRFKQVVCLSVFFSLSSDWLIKVISFLLIGCCDYFGFATLHTKALYSSTTYRLLSMNKVLLVIYHFPPKFSVRTAIILSTEPNMARWMMTGLFFSSPSPLNHQMTQQ